MLFKKLCFVIVLSIGSSLDFADRVGPKSQATTQTFERPSEKPKKSFSSKMYAEDKYKYKAIDSLYVGLDIQNNKLDLYRALKPITLNGKSDFIKTSLFAGSAFIGYRDHNLGSEIGFTLYRHQKASGTFKNGSFSIANTNIKIKSTNVYFDSIYYIPVLNRLDLKASFGLGFLHSSLKSNQALSINNSPVSASNPYVKEKLGLRFGLGAEMHFAKCFSTSIMGRYQTGNHIFKNVKTIALAFAYHI